DFVTLIELLRNLQCEPGGKTEPGICFSLQRGEIEKLWRRLGGRFFLFRDFARLMENLRPDRFGFCAIPETLGPAIFVLVLREPLVEPASTVSALLHIEICKDFPVGPGLKGANAFLPFCKDCQGGCLNPANRRKLETALF